MKHLMHRNHNIKKEKNLFPNLRKKYTYGMTHVNEFRIDSQNSNISLFIL